MSRKHQDVRWLKVRAAVKPRLLASLPHPCPRCGRIMEKGMPLDLGHILRGPAVDYDPSNLRLEHRACNRRDGQRITTAKKLSKSNRDRMPRW